MESLSPCLSLTLEVRQTLENGESARSALRRFARGDGEFERQCGRWLLLTEKGGDPDSVLREIRSPHRKTLLRLLGRSLRGEPVFPALMALETEIADACRAEMDRHLALLPMKLMVPLLLLIFPSMMVLLFGPLLEMLVAGVASP